MGATGRINQVWTSKPIPEHGETVTTPLVHRSANASSSRIACVRGLLVLALAVASFVPWGPASPPTFAQPATQREQPAPPPATPIPVPEIAQRAEDVATLLRQSAERLAMDPEVEDVDTRLPAASEWIRGCLIATAQTLVSSPSPMLAELLRGVKPARRWPSRRDPDPFRSLLLYVTAGSFLCVDAWIMLGHLCADVIALIATGAARLGRPLLIAIAAALIT
jgi:hypothetical protein